jgi:hypothetical protein
MKAICSARPMLPPCSAWVRLTWRTTRLGRVWPVPLAVVGVGCSWDMAGAPCAAAPTPCLDGYVCCAGRCETACGAEPPNESSRSNPTLAREELGTISSCAELTPTSASGIYRIEADTGPYRAYCDAGPGLELCADMPGGHSGITKDPSALAFTLTSVLENRACRVWNVKAQIDQRPLDALEVFDDDLNFLSVDPCLALGLPAAVDFRRAAGCPYGMDPGYGACGYDPVQDGTGLMKWSNGCLQCRVNGGNSHGYVAQGEIYIGHIPWDTTGQYSTVCGP